AGQSGVDQRVHLRSIRVVPDEPTSQRRKPAMKDTQKSASSSTATDGKAVRFSDEERAAMKEHVQELRMAARRGPRADKADGEGDVLAKIAEMREPDRAMAKRLHPLIKPSAPA